MGKAGDWIQTYSGRQFWPMDPSKDDIAILDIAHSLSMLCRFAGHCKRFYSVAEHSVLMARNVSAPNKLWALLHDASEAYLVDVPRPVKPFLAGYKEAENRIMVEICTLYGLPTEMPQEVKTADLAILTDEASQNMVRPPVAWSTTTEPLGVRLEYWEPSRARDEFLWAFAELQP